MTEREGIGEKRVSPSLERGRGRGKARRGAYELLKEDKVDSDVDERDAAAHKVGAVGRARGGTEREVSYRSSS